jgi:hypothetical protein
MATGALRDVQWHGAWGVEFVADIVATYLVGRAYLWQHVSLCLRRNLPPYRPAAGDRQTHPAPQARYTVINLLLGQNAPLALTGAWDGIRASAGQVDLFDEIYPPTLLAAIGPAVSAGLSALGLVPATAAPPGGIVVTLNDAWDRLLRDDSDAFLHWQAATLTRLEN